MYKVQIRFYEELNDFLPRHTRKKDQQCAFRDRRSVKDLIESLGVPHTEVDLILVNGRSVSFAHIVEDGDRISVYPIFETLPIKDVTRLRPAPLRVSRFVCDVHLGTLARRLRLLGFDTLFNIHTGDTELASLSSEEARILLTRDRSLLMRNIVTRGLVVRAHKPDEQVHEILERLHLRSECKPFTRCTMCNGLLERVRKEEPRFSEIETRIPERVRAWRDEYAACASCGRVYWEGTHCAKLRELVDAYVAGE